MEGRLFIDGRKVATEHKIVSENPSTLRPVGEACLAGPTECRAALEAAQKAFPVWKRTGIEKKRMLFRRAKSILLERAEDIAGLICAEKGTPSTEAMAVEVMTGLEHLDYYIRRLAHLLKPKKASPYVAFFKHKKSRFHFEPVGPTLVISPWNFPFLIPFLEVTAALAAGNTVVLRPSSTTPLSSLKIGEIFFEAGFPPGVVNIVNTERRESEELVSSPLIRTIVFTGGITTGRRIMELASKNLTDVILELGGKDPMIVCRDADLDRAAGGAVWGAFMNTGQSCGSVERLYVDQKIAETFIDKVLSLAKRLKTAYPDEPDTDIGPMATLHQLKIVEEHVKDAVAKGAKILCGGCRLDNFPGYFFPPTVIINADHSMKVMREETFGPLLPIKTFSHLEEAVTLANDSSFGLTASVWTRRRKTAALIAGEMETGTVTVNDHMFSFTEPGAIWGGPKLSGTGRSHGPFGMFRKQNIKYTSYDFSRKKNLLWWFPWRPEWPGILKNAMTLFHHEKYSKRAGALAGLIRKWGIIFSGSPIRNYFKAFLRIIRK
ncbi:MAG: aldehyde dehydrogenase family protein [Candidatus Aminicenantes bacterium]|nr:aldehyde dehydrogenase family protein [Candidatus Aminicenantes bacterium]